MKYFRHCFKFFQNRFPARIMWQEWMMSILVCFLVSGWAISEDLIYGEILPPVPDTLLLDLKRAARESDNRKALKSLCAQFSSTRGALYQVYSRKREAVTYWQGEDQSYILFYSFRLSEVRGAHGFMHNEGVGWMAPEDFDRWLLTEPQVLESVLKNETLLQVYLPDLPEPRVTLSLNTLHSYLFQVMRPMKHYNLAAIIGEDRFFSDITEDDFELRFMHVPLLHYTRLSGGQLVYFSKVSDILILQALPAHLKKYFADAELRKKFLVAFERMEVAQQGSFLEGDTLLADIKIILESISQKYDFSNIPEAHRPTLVEHVTRFLQSNGAQNLKDLQDAPDWLKIAVGERFFTAKTTAFFRDWRDMAYFEDWLAGRDEYCRSSGRPLKVKIFGCSTGQEPLSYAFMLLDQGVSNFRIYATDIDQSVIQEAMTMRYHRDKFLTLPTELKTHLLETYFKPAGDNFFEIRFRTFFEERIFYGVQDISLPFQPVSQDIYNPPYDILSVKNVLLYLDHAAVLETVPRLESMMASGGLLVIRDKRYRVSRFLDKQLKKSLGITGITALRLGGSESDRSVRNVTRLFEDPMPPNLRDYVDRFAREWQLTELREQIFEESIKASEEDLSAQKVCFRNGLDQGDPVLALRALQAICRADPIVFCPQYVKFYKAFPEHEFSQDQEFLMLLHLYQQLGMEGMEKSVKARLESIYKKYLVPGKGTQELQLVLAHVLSAIDQGRFAKIKRSPDGLWLQRALEQLRIQESAFKPSLFREHRAKLLDHFVSLYGHELSDLSRRKLVEENWDLFETSYTAPRARIALLKFAVFYSQMQIMALDERLRILTRMLDECRLEKDQVRYLTDRQYTEYSMMRGRALHFLAKKNPKLTAAVRTQMYREALANAEIVLGVRSVYANRALEFKDKLTAILGE